RGRCQRVQPRPAQGLSLMSAPLNTALIELRLRQAVPALDEVLGAAEYNAVRDLASFRPGTCYVVLAGERNPAGDMSQPQRKAVAAAVFGVIVAARNYRD